MVAVQRGLNEACTARRGFDVFVNMVLEDVEEYEITPEGKKVRRPWACGAGRPALRAGALLAGPPGFRRLLCLPLRATKLDPLLLRVTKLTPSLLAASLR